MRYHIFKSSRAYTGAPYCGPASNNVPAEAASLEEAQSLCMTMAAKNPVGWIIYDTEN